MFEGVVRELRIRRVLKQVSRQRVVTVLQPGNVWVIEKSVQNNEGNDAALKTCHMRGWLEPLSEAVPYGEIGRDGQLPDEISGTSPIWKLTDSGWAAINRAHEWRLLSVLVAMLGLFAGTR